MGEARDRKGVTAETIGRQDTNHLRAHNRTGGIFGPEAPKRQSRIPHISPTIYWADRRANRTPLTAVALFGTAVHNQGVRFPPRMPCARRAGTGGSQVLLATLRTPETLQTLGHEHKARQTHVSSASTSSLMSGSAHCRLFMFRRVLGSPHAIISALKLIACWRPSKTKPLLIKLERGGNRNHLDNARTPPVRPQRCSRDDQGRTHIYRNRGVPRWAKARR